MSIGEIIAILALLIAIFQTMLAWMSNEGISLSLSSGEWLRLFIVLIASALIVGGFFQASSEYLLVFFVGSFLMVELVNLVPKNGPLEAVGGLLVFLTVTGMPLLPIVSHACSSRSFVTIIVSLSSCHSDSFGNYYVFSALGSIVFLICVAINIENANNVLLVRLMNWLACGIGVCLGYWFRLIFV